MIPPLLPSRWSGHPNIVQHWSYVWLHVPTGRKGQSRTDHELTRVRMLEQINNWNRQGAGIWHYWMET